jgi:hypothetical protein
VIKLRDSADDLAIGDCAPTIAVAVRAARSEAPEHRYEDEGHNKSDKDYTNTSQ